MWRRREMMWFGAEDHSAVEHLSPTSCFPFGLVWSQGPVTLGRLCPEWLTLCDSGEELAHTWPFQVSGPGCYGRSSRSAGSEPTIWAAGMKAPDPGLSHCSSFSILALSHFHFPAGCCPVASDVDIQSLPTLLFIYSGVFMKLLIYTF